MQSFSTGIGALSAFAISFQADPLLALSKPAAPKYNLLASKSTPVPPEDGGPFRQQTRMLSSFFDPCSETFPEAFILFALKMAPDLGGKNHLSTLALFKTTLLKYN